MHTIFRKEIIELLNGDAREIFKKADSVRKKFCGDKIYIRGIIEFSNHCCRSCLYCGLRRENKNILRYRMLPGQIITLANQIAQQGIKTVLLQSGDDFGYNRKALSNIIYKIKNANPEIAITLSLGERPFDDYKAFKDAGADRYLLRHEAANPKLYARLHPGNTLKRRIKILEYLKKLDYQVGAGNIVGLPGQTLGDLADDILLIKRLDADMAGIGPFIPQSETPLKNFPFGNLDLTLKILALTRIITENTHLPVTTALATLSPEDGLVMGLKAGANVIMPDFTPEGYRKQYQIYDGKVRINLKRTGDVILKAKRKISLEKGDSLKCKKPQKACACI